MVESGIAADLLTDSIETLRKQGQTVIMIAIDGKAAGLLGVADPIKKTTLKALAELHKRN